MPKPASLLKIQPSRLLAMAAKLREREFGASIQLCAIVNIRSGRCEMDCAFCSQNRNATHKNAALLAQAEILARIQELAQTPVERIGLVSSGAALGETDFSSLCAALEQLSPDIRARLCCSLGRISPSKLERLKNLGITRYHHNLETSPAFYSQICSTQQWRQRQETVKAALSLGMSVCSGAIFGVGETWRDRVALAQELKKLQIRHIPLNFLHPQSNTRFSPAKPLEADEALRIIALYRALLPQATLRVCGGRPITFGARQPEIFAAGANALMTGNYLTTCGESLANDLRMLAGLGLKPGGWS